MFGGDGTVGNGWGWLWRWEMGVVLVIVGLVGLCGGLERPARDVDEGSATGGAEDTMTLPHEGTQGTLAHGTVLRLDGVEVAELWAIRGGRGMEALAVDLTAHGSASRFHEAAQGLREFTRLEVMGAYLAAQAGTWVEALNDDDLHKFQVIWPDGDWVYFEGFVSRVKVGTATVGDAETFEAEAVVVPDTVLTRIMRKGGVGWWTVPDGEVEVCPVDWWHCVADNTGHETEAPRDDPTHWEPVLVAPGEATIRFGYDGAATGNLIFNPPDDYRGNLWPYKTGGPSAAYKMDASGVGAPWPESMVLSGDGDYMYLCVGVVTEATNTLTGVAASIIDGTVEEPAYVSAAVYSAAGTLLGSSAMFGPYVGDIGWVTMALTAPVVLTPGESYALIVYGRQTSIYYNAFSAYAPPSGGDDWKSGTTYTYCTTVYDPEED